MRSLELLAPLTFERLCWFDLGTVPRWAVLLTLGRLFDGEFCDCVNIEWFLTRGMGLRETERLLARF